MASTTKRHGVLDPLMLSGTGRRVAWPAGLAAFAAVLLAAAGAAQAQSIAMHWTGYYANSSDVAGVAGVVANANWTNVWAGWFSVPLGGNNTNLIDSNGLPTTAAVNLTVPGEYYAYWGSGWGSYYYYDLSNANLTNNVLKGPGGGGGHSEHDHGHPLLQLRDHRVRQ
jgi:hypothetical protein